MTTGGKTTTGRIRAGRLQLLAGAGALLAGVGLALGATAAHGVEYGNPSFQGVLNAQPPRGFPVSPAWVDLSRGPVTLTVTVSVTNLTQTVQTVPLHFTVHHILTFQGHDISDGQPGQPGITFPVGAAAQTTQAPYGPVQSNTFAVPAGQPTRATLSFSFPLSDCGYYQIDFSSPRPPYSYLASGFTRALECGSNLGSTSTTSTTTSTTSTTSSTLPKVVPTAVAQLPVTGSTPDLLVISGLFFMIGATLLRAGRGLKPLKHSVRRSKSRYR